MAEENREVMRLSGDEARDLVENAPCGLVITDRDGAISFCNARFALWTGRDRETLARMRFRDLLDTVSQIYYDTHILPMILLQGHAREILCRLQAPDGDRMPIVLNAGLRPATDDRPVRIEFTLFDATERATYEADLRRARDDAEELASIVRNADVGILRIDRQGRVTRSNAAAERLFGFTADQAQGSDLSKLIALEDRPDWVATSIKAADASNSHHRFDAKCANGMNLNVTVAQNVGPDRSDAADYYSVILRDVTQRVAHERQLKVIMEELNHRVKNTLAVVDSIARQTFKSPGSEDERQQFTSRLRALARAHDLLVKGNWESGSLREIVEVNVRDSNRDAAFIIQGPELHFPSSDLTMLSMTLFELTTNAIKYGALAQPDGRVHLTWHISGGDPKIFTLEWVEQGARNVVKPTRRGFGSQMIERLVTAELQGSAEVTYDPGGLRYRLSAPFNGRA